MGPKQHHLYSKPEYINSQHASFYCNIHHNMVHFTAISITTWLILLQYPSQHGSFYCNIHHNMVNFTAISITTWFILLQYPSQHGSFYCNIHHNMVHFTAISTTTRFTLLQDTPQPGSFYCNITTCFLILNVLLYFIYCNYCKSNSFELLIKLFYSYYSYSILLQYKSQHASFYCNMLHFTAISTTTCFILLQYQQQHASFYWNMLHFTGIKTSFS